MEHLRLTLLAVALLSGISAQAQIPGLQSFRLLRNGNQALQEAQPLKADSVFSRHLKTDPNNPYAQMGLGNALYQQAKPDSARYWFEKAAETFQTPAYKSRAHHNVGNTYLKADKWAEAAQQYKEALKLQPDNDMSRYNLAYALKKLKQQQQQQQQQKQQQKQQQQQQEQQQQQQQQQKQEQQQEQQPQKNNPKQQMQKKDAERILDALNRQEKEVQKKREKDNPGGNPTKPEKDW